MLKIGDIVVTMSYPGLFTVVGIEGDVVTIRDEAARVVTVQAANVRRVKRDEPLPD